jgi:LPPG:FO 2-phospho-L-lactate transferase
VARRYADLLDGYVMDRADVGASAGLDAGGLDIGSLGIPVTVAHTLMATLEDRERLAREVLAAADALAAA